MRCEEFLRRLDAEEECRTGEAAAHAAACPACGRAAERMEAASAALRGLRAEDEPPPFLHTRVMAHVRGEGARRPVLGAGGWFRLAWAGPLFAVAVVFLLGGYGLRQVVEPSRRPVPREEMATPAEMAGAGPSTAADGRLQTPRVELPRVGERPEKTKQEAQELDAKLRRGGEGTRPGSAGAFAPEPAPSLKKDAGNAPAGSEEALASRALPAAPVAAPSAKGTLADKEQEAAGASAPPAAPSMADAGGARLRERDESRGNAPGSPRPASPPPAAEGKGAESGAGDQLAAMEAPKRYLLVDLVECTLRTEGNREYVVLKLPPTEAPPPGQSWDVTVSRDGAVAVRDADGRWLKEVAAYLESRAAELRLNPGRYHLGRVAP